MYTCMSFGSWTKKFLHFFSEVWIPWAIGFAFQVNMCVTSTVLSIVSIRDMYHFDPIPFGSVPNVDDKQEPSAEPLGEYVMEVDSVVEAENDCIVYSGIATPISVV